MSVAVGCRILSRVCGNRAVNTSSRNAIVRFNCTRTLEETTSVEASTASASPLSEPDKFSAAVLRKFSEPLVLENLEPPKTLRPEEVLIDVHYCAVNGADALITKDLYTPQPNLPTVLGYELVGKLIRIGENAEKKGYKVGDKVVALNKDRYGGLAEQCVAEVDDIWRVPSNIKSLDAVALLENYVTALLALERKVNLQEDDMILINIGVSGIGLAAADLATNVYRAKVIGVCATEDGAALAREKGLFASLKFKGRKLLKQIEEIAADRNIKGIFDDASGEHFKKILNCFTDIYKKDATLKDLLRDDNFAVVMHHLSREGRVIVAGAAQTITDAQSDVQKDSFSVTGFSLREYRKKKPELYRQAGDEVLQLFEEGLITPTSSLIVGLNRVNDAIEFVLESKSSGKVIVSLKEREVYFKCRDKYYRFLLRKYHEEWCASTTAEFIF